MDDLTNPDVLSKPAIVAWARGFGPGWPRTLASEVTEAEPIRLVPDDVPIIGRIVDLEGRPVAGVTVRVDTLWGAESPEAIDRWQQTVAQSPTAGERPRSHYFPIQSQLPGIEPAVSTTVTTDANGRFRMIGLGRDRLAVLDLRVCRSRSSGSRWSRGGWSEPWAVQLDEPGLEDSSYYGASPTIVVEPGRPIEGIVRDADTKTPIAGAIVTAMQLAGSRLSIEGLLSTVSDAQGHYRLVGLPKGDGHKLSVYPPLDQPYFITERLNVAAGPGLGPVRFDIALHKGIWIAGRVTDAETGRPVQAAIHYYPYLANKHAEGFPNFRANSISFYWTASRYRADAEGRFRVVALPGRGIVAVKSFDRAHRLGIGSDRLSERPSRQAMRRDGLPTYNQINPQEFEALAEVDPAEGVAEAKQDFLLQPSASLTVQLLDPEGKPLTHATAHGRFPSHRDLGDTNLYDQSKTQVFGLEPAENQDGRLPA